MIISLTKLRRHLSANSPDDASLRLASSFGDRSRRSTSRDPGRDLHLNPITLYFINFKCNIRVVWMLTSRFDTCRVSSTGTWGLIGDCKRLGQLWRLRCSAYLAG